MVFPGLWVLNNARRTTFLFTMPEGDFIHGDNPNLYCELNYVKQLFYAIFVIR
jgi:hypothetical protein